MNSLKLLRAEHNLTQQDLALEMGVSQPAIQQYEAGVNEPNIEMLKKLSDYFCVTIDFLVGHTTVRGPLDDKDTQLAYQLNHIKNEQAKMAAIALLSQVRQDD